MLYIYIYIYITGQHGEYRVVCPPRFARVFGIASISAVNSVEQMPWLPCWPGLLCFLKSAWFTANAAWYMSHYLQNVRLFWAHTLNFTVKYLGGEIKKKKKKKLSSVKRSPPGCSQNAVFVKHSHSLSHKSNYHNLTKWIKPQLRSPWIHFLCNRTNSWIGTRLIHLQ